MTITFEPLHESHFPLLLKWLETSHVKKWWPADRSLIAHRSSSPCPEASGDRLSEVGGADGSVGGDQDVKYTLELVREKYGSRVSSLRTEGEAIQNNDSGCIASSSTIPCNDIIKGFIIHNNRNPIGYVQIYNAHDFRRSKTLSGLPAKLGAIDIYIGEEVALGQGLGSKAILEFLKLRGNPYTHIFVDPDSNNVAAIKAYEKAGFKRISEQEDTGEVWMIKRIKKVRLSDHDLDALEICFKKHFLENDRLWLFGSRADLNKKGGDIDLYVETYAQNVDIALKMKRDFLIEFEEIIGEQKIDLVLNMMHNQHPLPIHEIAKTKGVRIL